MYDEATRIKVEQWKQKIASGAEVTLEEAREMIALLRAGRASAAPVSKPAKTAPPSISLDDLM